MLHRLFSPVLILAVLFLGTACARSSGLVKPGDTIGEMVAVKATPDAIRYTAHCKLPADTPDPLTPGTYQIDCQVPPSKFLWLDDGWFAKGLQTLDENWRAFTFEMSIDDRQVDLEAFGTADEVKPGGDSGRTFNLALENASGKHIVRLVHQIKEDVFDGYTTYQAGTYEMITNFTVTSE